jgi:CubicO group peptidase (beta-lactamase class C family)
MYCSGTCQQKDSTANTLTRHLEQIYEQGHINGFSVALVNSEDILYAKGFGFADVAKKRNTQKIRFRT